VIFASIGNPVKLLILAGAVNGIILPIALAVILIAATKTSIMNQYKHPLWMQLVGWTVVIAMSWMSVLIIQQTAEKF
jgi:Mn2+/Fe2+ NRAMP family transporter